MVHQDPNVGVAFALVIGAGAATALGASVVFFPSLVRLASRRVLARALGGSAGVMLYVSFVDIFTKTVGYFEETPDTTPEIAFAYTTCCFFGGVVFMMLMDGFIHWLGRLHRKRCLDREDKENVCVEVPREADDPIAELETWQELAAHEVQERDNDATVMVEMSETQGSNADDDDYDGDVETGLASPPSRAPDQQDADDGRKGSSINKKDSSLISDPQGKLTLSKQEQEENSKLVHMGFSTAVAIALHNFPEGLAAFVAALGDVRVGFVFALAIAIHNIPEGLCVALPIYYGTGSRWKAFGWACLSGVSEPLGALLGWAILINHFTPTVYAILFGIVAGMMVFIVIKELLPTAHRYDPEDTVVSYSVIVGMAVMAMSLVLFVL